MTSLRVPCQSASLRTTTLCVSARTITRETTAIFPCVKMEDRWRRHSSATVCKTTADSSASIVSVERSRDYLPFVADFWLTFAREEEGRGQEVVLASSHSIPPAENELSYFDLLYMLQMMLASRKKTSCPTSNLSLARSFSLLSSRKASRRSSNRLIPKLSWMHEQPSTSSCNVSCPWISCVWNAQQPNLPVNQL